MMEQGRLAPQHHKYSIYRKNSDVGDFRFCLIRKVPSASSDISSGDRNAITAKYAIRHFCGSPAEWYGLENSSLIFEYVPLFAKSKRQHKLAYVEIPENVAALNERSVPENDDVFSEKMRDASAWEAAMVEEDVIGGHTASFRPVTVSEDDEGESE